MWIFKRYTWLAILIISALNIAIWSFINMPAGGGAYTGMVGGFSFSPYQANQNPESGDHPSLDEIAADLAIVHQAAHGIRTYSVLHELGDVPRLATAKDIDITIGAWISPDAARNEAELSKLIAIANSDASNKTMRRLMVGNEALLRTDVTPEELISFIKRVQANTTLPVSTAEPWHVWLEEPELAAAVDFITVHILPYWEGVPIDGAVNYVFFRLQELQQKYPDKHIVIGETGWPSEGAWVRGAEPSRINQEKFMREFLTRAAAADLDYYIVEAFDQPWKVNIEGSVGAYWGFFDKDRQPKLQLQGLVTENIGWHWAALAATLLALFPLLYFSKKQSGLSFWGVLFFGALLQLVCSLLVWTVLGAFTADDAAQMGFVWFVAFLAQLVLLAVLLADGFEFTEMLFATRLQRLFGPAPADHARAWPKVSIHVPCYNEPPQMVIDTIKALQALDYPNFEVLVIDNNTKDAAVWQPLQDYCTAANDARLRFVHLDNWPGYKAGALNYGLSITAADAEIVAVIDSDYQVTPNWLRATIPYFDNPKMAIVQAPQDYRDWRANSFQAMCHWEYAGFFYIGMVHRNERNAIIQHGTMTQVRKSALAEVGGWAEWCITEDAELGLKLFAAGYEAAYLPHSFGQGLIPDGFSAYKTQRFRWAYGAIQILKRHWRKFTRKEITKLTAEQRFHFLAGWLPWIADAALVFFTLAALVWSALLSFELVEFPPIVFLIPTLCVFMFKITAGLVLYGARVKASWGQRLGAALAGLSLTHTVGRAVWQAFFTSGKPFVRTPKLADKPALVQGVLMASEEILLLLGLLVAATSVLIIYTPANQEALLWAIVLYLQTLPYWAALIVALINALPRLQRIQFFIGK